MPSTVRIKAICADNEEVTVSITDNQNSAVVAVESFTLLDGEVAERVVYDDLEITVREHVKG